MTMSVVPQNTKTVFDNVPSAVDPKTTVGDILVPPPPERKEGSNILANTLTGLALLGAAGMLIHSFRKGGKGLTEKTIEAFKKEGNYFEKGIAKCKDGTLFSGVITHTDKAGNNYIRIYNDGSLKIAKKNIDLMDYADMSKAENFIKKYDADGITRAVVTRDGVTQGKIVPKNIKTVEKFADDFGSFVDGKPVNADGSHFNGFIVEKDGGNTLIKEYANGKQVSERLNTTLRDNVMKPDVEHYVLDEAGLIRREHAKIAEEQARIAHEKECQKLSYKIKSFFKNLFTKKNNEEVS